MTSGPAVCVPTGTYEGNGIESSFVLSCVQQNVATDITISFACIAPGFVIGGQTVDTIYSMKIESITGLPCGLCWASNKTEDIVFEGDEGCIRVVGTTNDAEGQYLLTVIVSLDTEGNNTFNYTGIAYNTVVASNNRFVLRVVNPLNECLPLNMNSSFASPIQNCN